MDAAAKNGLVVEIYLEKDPFVRSLLRQLGTAVLALLAQDVPTGIGTVKATVVVSDRWSGESIYEQDYGRDLAAANVGKETIEKDLDRLTLREFLAEYGIDWKPPASNPASSR